MSPLAAGPPSYSRMGWFLRRRRNHPMRLYEGGPGRQRRHRYRNDYWTTKLNRVNQCKKCSGSIEPSVRSSANKQRKLHARWLTARSCRDGSLRGSLRGPAAMVVARSCRDGRCAVLPRWSLRGPAAMVAARSCRDGSLRGPAAMAHCAVLPRWSLRGPAAMCFPNMEAAPPPLRRVPPCAV